MALKFLIDEMDNCELSYLVEEKNKNEPQSLFIQGPYLVAESVNRNNRKYSKDEMITEVARYTNEMINAKRSIGELNHPMSVDINPREACHIITEFKQDGNIFVGKSKILSTPMGQITKALLLDGVKLGISSRALGKLKEGQGYQNVEGFHLITCDVVTNPSANGCFVNSIMEAKEYIINSDGTIAEAVGKAFEGLEKNLNVIPKHEVNEYLKTAFTSFIQSLKKI
jgi:hypothetical protein